MATKRKRLTDEQVAELDRVLAFLFLLAEVDPDALRRLQRVIGAALRRARAPSEEGNS